MSMGASWRSLLKRLTPKGRTLHLYSRLLPSRLRADYGHRGPYTPAQIETTIRRYKVGDRRYIPYAIAIFADNKALPATWNGSELQGVRNEVSAAWFDGASFSYLDVISYCSDRGADIGECHTRGHASGEHSHHSSTHY